MVREEGGSQEVLMTSTAESMLTAFVLCDSNPDDRPAWEAFHRDLQRRGHNGPLPNFVEQYIKDRV